MDLSLRQNQWFKIVELAALFFGIPLSYYFFFKDAPLFFVLWIATVLIAVLLYRNKSFDWKTLGMNGFKDWKGLLIRFTILFVSGVALVAIIDVEKLFFLPRYRPELWLMIMVLYPVFSAIPQELIYRSFFFHRYQFISNTTVLVVINAAAFSLSHIVFDHWITLVLTFFGSFILTNTYKKHKSMLITGIEHGLYGNIIFTVGLNEFFYKAPPPM